MAARIRLLFDVPQSEIASELRDLLNRCASAQLVAGFITVEGIEAIAGPIRANPQKISCLVAGAGTFRAFDAMDSLLAAGVPNDRLFVHLGHTRNAGAGAKHPFYRYHPMLHSKVYLFDLPDQTVTAFVGSHNLTGFALHGLNGEAGIRVDGQPGDPEITGIRQHIGICVSQSVQYDAAMKAAYSWWALQFFEGLRDKVDDAPKEGEGKRTIIIIAEAPRGKLPKKNDIIYFELPSDLGQIRSLSAEVHIYLFDVLPPTPSAALANLGGAKASCWCLTRGLEHEQGGVELKANWFIQDSRKPKLQPAPKNFRPNAQPDMQQVRVKALNNVFGDFDYVFAPEKAAWEPIYNDEHSLQVPDSDRQSVAALRLIPPEDKQWFLVKDLRPREAGTSRLIAAMMALSPESGGYILFSQRRREVDRTEKHE